MELETSTTFSKLTNIFEKLYENNKLTAGIDNISGQKYIDFKPSEASIKKPTLNLEGIRFIMHLANKIDNQKFKFSPYMLNLIPKGKNKLPRIINIPTIKDKIILAYINDELKNVFNNDNRLLKIPAHTIGAMKKHFINFDYKYVSKFDLTKFYDTIDHSILIELLEGKVDPYIITLVSHAIKNPTFEKDYHKYEGMETANNVGVPQGLAISNILAEIYMQQVDEKMQENTDIVYFRYVDDILILHKNKITVNKFASELVSELSYLNLELNTDKTETCNRVEQVKDFVYLGYRFNGTQITIKKENVMKMEMRLQGIISQYKRALDKYVLENKDDGGNVYENEDYKKLLRQLKLRINVTIGGSYSNDTYYSWIGYFSSVNSPYQFKMLDHTLNKILRKILKESHYNNFMNVKINFNDEFNSDFSENPHKLNNELWSFMFAYNEMLKNRKRENKIFTQSFNISEISNKTVECLLDLITYEKFDKRSDFEKRRLLSKFLHRDYTQIKLSATGDMY